MAINTDTVPIKGLTKIKYPVKEIGEDFANGMTIEGLVEKYGGKASHHIYILTKIGLYLPPEHQNTLIPENNTEGDDLSEIEAEIDQNPLQVPNYVRKYQLVVEKYRELKNITATAEAMKLSYNQVYYLLNKANQPLFKPNYEVIAQYLEAGHTKEDAAGHFGLNLSTLITGLRSYYIKKNYGKVNRSNSPERIQKDRDIQAYIDAGHSQSETAEHFGMSQPSICNRLKRLKKNKIQNAEQKKNSSEIEKNITFPKRTDDVLKSYFEEGHSQSEAAKFFGVSESAISQHIKRLKKNNIIITPCKKTPRRELPPVTQRPYPPPTRRNNPPPTNHQNLIPTQRDNGPLTQRLSSPATRKPNSPITQHPSPPPMFAISSPPKSESSNLKHTLAFYDRITESAKEESKDTSGRDTYANVKKYPSINLDAIKTKIDLNQLPIAPVPDTFDLSWCAEKKCDHCPYYVITTTNQRSCRYKEVVHQKRFKYE